MRWFGFVALVLVVFLAAFDALALEVGKPSPAFEIQRSGASGQPPITLASFRGKVVLLALIDVNCQHCRDLTRDVLIPVAREYGLRGVQVVQCAFNDTAQMQVPGFIQEFQPPYPVGWNNRAAILSYLGISVFDQRPLYVPRVVILDREGVVRGEFPGESAFFRNAGVNVRAELDKLLAAQAQKSAGKKTASRKK